jgi:hypothetical protein
MRSIRRGTGTLLSVKNPFAANFPSGRDVGPDARIPARRPFAATERGPQAQRRRYQERLRAQGRCIYGCGRRIDAPRSQSLCRQHRLQTRRQRHGVYWRHRPPCYCECCHELIDPMHEPRQRKYHRACARIVLQQQAAARQRITSGTDAGKATHRRAARAYQRRHAVQGLCVYCPRKARPGHQTCRKHDRRRQ